MENYARQTLIPTSYNLGSKIPVKTWLLAFVSGIGLWALLISLL